MQNDLGQIGQSLGLMQQESPSSKTYEHAPFFIRFLATVIDGMIIGISTNIIERIISFLFSFVGIPQIIASLLAWVFQIAAVYYYYGHFYSIKGATPGKQVFRLRVQDNDTAQNIPKAKAFWRETLGKFVSGLILMIGFIMAAFRDDGRALHDLMFNTRVVRLPKE